MKDIEQRLLEKGIRPTAMRMLAYQYMADANVAISLTDIENALSPSDRTTLFRTMKTFEHNGLAHQIDDGTGIQKYALCEPGCNCELEQDLHLHFHCNSCDETVCLTAHKIPHINLPKGFVAEDVNLDVKGICDNCCEQ